MDETETASPFGEASVGQRLRRAREAKGLTLEEIATTTRIPIRHLRSIEESNWGELPALTYTTGFARSYANAVGLDGVEIGRQLRAEQGGTDRVSPVSPNFYEPPDPARVPSRPLAWAAAVLAVVLVGLYLLWRSQLPEEGDPADPQPTAQATQPASEQPQPAPAPQSLQGQPVVLVASGPVWFRITDRDGNRRIAERTLNPGDSFPVPPEARQPVIRTSEPQNLRIQIAGRDIGPLSATRVQMRDQSLLAADLAQRAQGQAQPGSPAPPQRALPDPSQPAQSNGFRPLL
jgi:cytoskeleton protein RodZ